MTARAITLHGRELPTPAVCAPLVGRTREALLEEARIVAAKLPDLIEWRVDCFENIGDVQRVLDAGRELRAVAGGIPLLFTRRSVFEGGEKIAVDEAAVVALAAEVCASGVAEMIDWEMDREAAHVQAVRDAARTAGVQLVLSFHDFQATPTREALLARFRKARDLGADVAKIAVMPRSMDDVLTLLGATHGASAELGIPLVSMAMGPLGAVTRMCGSVFGSAMSFAVGAQSSAPGQMPIEDVRAAVAMLQRAMQVR